MMICNDTFTANAICGTVVDKLCWWKREEQLEEYSRRDGMKKKDTPYWLDGGKSAIAHKVAKEVDEA